MSTGLDDLSDLLEACEEDGTKVQAKHINLGKKVVAEGGPLDRVEKAIAHLSKELANG